MGGVAELEATQASLHLPSARTRMAQAAQAAARAAILTLLSFNFVSNLVVVLLCREGLKNHFPDLHNRLPQRFAAPQDDESTKRCQWQDSRQRYACNRRCTALATANSPPCSHIVRRCDAPARRSTVVCWLLTSLFFPTISSLGWCGAAVSACTQRGIFSCPRESTHVLVLHSKADRHTGGSVSSSSPLFGFIHR